MPINEREYHPYLFEQVANFNDPDALSKYNKLIIGTFPIYALTDSEPIGDIGFQKKINWFSEAFMRYFYGSKKNYFWHLFSNVFKENLPLTNESAVEMLNRHGFLLIDAFLGIFRNEYSPLDKHIIDPIPNHHIIDLLQNCKNLKIIYFTSQAAKASFCKALNIIPPIEKDSTVNYLNRIYRLIELITPASNARSAWNYRHNFPLLPEEINNKANGNRYALAYRQRYYSYYLSMP